MKKNLQIGISFILIVFTLFFTVNIFLDKYFNKNFYINPNLKGMTVEEVKEKIPNKIIKVQVVGKDFSKLPVGQIFMQKPEAKHILKKGRTVKVWVSMGENYYEVPDFSGQQLFQVKRMLEERGIKIKNIARTDYPLAYNSVITTNPGPGEYVNSKDGIFILVSNRTSNKMVEVPDVIGFSLEEAKEILQKKSIFIDKVETIEVEGLESGIVVDTNLEIKSKISSGSNINLIVSK
ncbi:MAG: PASTA domain-containing protein [Fusobacterium sp. JB021]|nr:PASTA domain-containing protein [Fusobacterium sp. JB021]MDP0506306.1 PASTA domain-containing protein [Fusobacterium sp. JB019]